MTYEHIVEWLAGAFYAYLAAGLGFAIIFAIWGVGKLDAGARGTGVGFRLIILPGVTALWPMLLRRWLRGSPAPVERTPHR